MQSLTNEQFDITRDLRNEVIRDLPTSGGLTLQAVLPPLQKYLDTRLVSGDESELFEALELIHEAIHSAQNRTTPVLGKDRHGEVVIIKDADPVLIASGHVSALTSRDEVLTQFKPHLDRLVNIYDLHFDDDELEDDELAWLAAHNLSHLRDHGARELVWDRLEMDVETIDSDF